MPTYLMLGKYSPESLKSISAERTNKALAVLKENGGELKAGYALLGQNDLALIVDLPDTERVVKTGVALSNLLGVAFNTAPAITLKEFDKLVG